MTIALPVIARRFKNSQSFPVCVDQEGLSWLEKQVTDCYYHAINQDHH